MEYVEGRTLRDVINREAPLPPLRALELIEPVLAALAAAHDAGLVHRDVKPENVLISDRGQIKVADFGLAKAISSQTSTATQGLLIGTVSYLPPELVLSGRPMPAPTSTAPAWCCSSCSPAASRTPARPRSRSRTPTSTTTCRRRRAIATAGPIPPYLDALVARATARDPGPRRTTPGCC